MCIYNVAVVAVSHCCCNFWFVFSLLYFLGLEEIRCVTVAVDFSIGKEKTRGITKLKSIK